MKNLLTILSVAILLIACEKGKTTASTGSDKTDSASTSEWKPVDSATAMKDWMAYSTPGEMQKMFCKI